MCQVMGILMKKTPRLESRGRRSDAIGPPDLDFLRLVLVCHCHAPRADRLGGWFARFHPLCDTLAAPCRMGSREALRTKIVFPLEVHPCPVSKATGMQDLPLFRG